MKILVTGGAGFVGSHITDELVKLGHKVRVYDNLCPQVHGVAQKPPSYLSREAEFVQGDVRDKDKLSEALKGIEVVYHDAAVVGVGQSMYEVHRYADNNVLGTANLLDIIVNQKNSVRKIIVASSMSIYGEGAYRCGACGPVHPELRSQEQLERREWEHRCPRCGASIVSVPTPEDKTIFATSVYSITKRDQEDMCLTTCRAYKIPCVALRYFNIYGPRQSISNPYTGVLAIFMSRIKNKTAPIVFEDGRQTRDFIHVRDIVQANVLALKKEADDTMFNVGTGRATSLSEIISCFSEVLKIKIEPDYTHKYRQGDIRHCYADIAKIQERLGFRPSFDLKAGLRDLWSWGEHQTAEDRLTQAMKELDHKKLIV